MPPPKPAPLQPSELGTKEYWDNLYATELANHTSNPQDTGTVWFDDADAEAKMVQYLAALADDDNDENEEGSFRARTILDLGCGNGSLLRAVREELFAEGLEEEEGGDGTKAAPPPPRLLGVDYSEASIALAQSVNDQEEEDDDDDEDDDDAKGAVPITFRVWDMLQGSADDLDCPGGWDLVLDKGTFDAISLGNSAPQQGQQGRQGGDGQDGQQTAGPSSVEVQYRAQIIKLLRPGGRFLITSCNWTETELCAWMEDDEERARGAWLVKAGRVAYPSFQFGGVQGQTVCTVCFEKVAA
ncbi:Protein-lysine N-methyltransferase efm4 [Sporothrix curviconia]|uniref:Protein-lysine N-methyltransferase EFM4 n=1 Tax=Sporothrix curviconia TaxID=1260050 RepID=A0ABP0C5N5_9PEZI